MTQGATHATDYTNASRTLLFNLETLDWDDGLLAALGIPRALLPELRPSVGFFGDAIPALLGARFRSRVSPAISMPRSSAKPASRAVFCSPAAPDLRPAAA